MPVDIAVFARQLATMMAAGIPMVQAFEIIGNGHEKPAMQKLVLDIKSTIEGGSTLHESLAKHPLYFDDLFVNLVEAGEQAGALETLLDKIATYKEKTEALKKKIKKALFYPAAVLIVAVIVSCILLIFVIPQFESLFKGFGADLPAFTQMVVNLSRFMQHRAGCWTGGRRRHLRVHVFPQALEKHAPRDRPGHAEVSDHRTDLDQVCDRALRANAVDHVRGGRAVGRGMQSVAGATGNIVYEEATLRMKDEVATGQRLQRAMENTGLFPNMVVQMIAVGEESGSLDTMSAKVAEFYEAESTTLWTACRP